MKERLRKNICNLDDHAVLSEIKDLPVLRAIHISNALEYACHFWTNHLAKVPRTSDGAKEVQKAVDDFFENGLLHWIEVLILTENLDIGVYALNAVEQWYISVSCVQNLCQSHSLCFLR